MAHGVVTRERQARRHGDAVALGNARRQFHIFRSARKRDNGGLPTRFPSRVSGPRGWGDGFQEDKPFEKKTSSFPRQLEQRLFHGTVTWSRTFR
ncbi:MAG: hypothetical protein Ct9H300mP1_38330 [Planctomycetaceae bacterium]|nr:MAG: hypothetical protein Ct9H300mP1_38330 [Planctomycetaceae bacterium]